MILRLKTRESRSLPGLLSASLSSHHQNKPASQTSHTHHKTPRPKAGPSAFRLQPKPIRKNPAVRLQNPQAAPAIAPAATTERGHARAAPISPRSQWTGAASRQAEGRLSHTKRNAGRYDPPKAAKARHRHEFREMPARGGKGAVPKTRHARATRVSPRSP